MIVPPKLNIGDKVCIIAPSRSLAFLQEQAKHSAIERFSKLGLHLKFAAHVEEDDAFRSSSVTSRIADLHDAYRDCSIKAIFAAIGGYNTNDLLRHIDFTLIQENPKILCGYSDITALQNAIHAKTGLITYSGPNFSKFGMKHGNDYTLKYLKLCLFEKEPFPVFPSNRWSDDLWYEDQNNRTFHQNEGPWVVHPGTAEGVIIGGNLCTLNLLQGTQWMPRLRDSILFLEDSSRSNPETFCRDLQSLLHQRDISSIRGLVIGRFQSKSGMNQELLQKIIETREELAQVPVIANVDFGHTNPIFTFPIGGRVSLEATFDDVSITILTH